jgi:UPF0755 protein
VSRYDPRDEYDDGSDEGGRRRMFAGLIGALATFGLIGLVVLLAGLWAYKAPGPAAHGGSATTVFLRKHAGVAEMASALGSAGVIRSPSVFVAAAEITHASRHLKPGEYAIPSRASLAEVLRMIRNGEIVHHRVTLPEGITSAQAVAILNANDVLVGETPTPPEGALLPQTYDVVRGEQRAAVLQRMMDADDKLVAVLWEHRKAGLPFTTPAQAITLASIVEKETALGSERPRVAAVYINRLRAGMKLQADPTVIYGVTGGAPLGRGIRQSELDNPTPYNTYANYGLPIGPIGNPGRASLAAVLDPPDTDELYFVADGSGGHVFSHDYSAHAKNVAKWRSVEQQRAALATAPKPLKPLEHR